MRMMFFCFPHSGGTIAGIVVAIVITAGIVIAGILAVGVLIYKMHCKNKEGTLGYKTTLHTAI